MKDKHNEDEVAATRATRDACVIFGGRKCSLSPENIRVREHVLNSIERNYVKRRSVYE